MLFSKQKLGLNVVIASVVFSQPACLAAAGASSDVCYLGVWGDDDLATFGRQAQTQVGVFVVKEEGFIEATNFVHGGAPDEHASA